MKHIIYLTTNLINGKIYIGQHRVKHLDNDPDYFGSGVEIKAAIKKYGVENFTRDILCECSCLEDANILEKEYISLYDSTNREIGYNIAIGGENFGSSLVWIKNNNPEKWNIIRNKMIKNGEKSKTKFKVGHKLSEESIDKMKRHLPKKRKPLSQATKNKIGNANCGKTSWAKGKKVGPLSQETREKISLAHKGKELSDSHRAKIGDSLRGRPLTLAHRKKLSKSKKGVPCEKNYKPIRSITTGIVYNSLKEAAQKNNMKTTSGLSDCLAGRVATCYKQKWEYV